MLSSPESTPAPEKNRFPTVDTNMQTHVSDEASPPPPDVGRADTAVATPDDLHELPTVADVGAPDLSDLAMTVPAESTPRPATLIAPADLIDDTDTQTAPGALAAEAAQVDVTSPFSQAPSEDSVDSGVFTKTVLEVEAVPLLPSKLPPLPVPRTPLPIAAPPARRPGLPPRPNSSSSAPPLPDAPPDAPPLPAAASAARPTKPTGAPPIPGSVGKKASSSGVLTSAMPPPASAQPSNRPSDVLPRPPPSAVIRPGQPANASPAPPAGAPQAPGMPGAEAAMVQNYPTPSHLAQPPAPGMQSPVLGMAAPGMQSPIPGMAPAGMQSPVPPGMVPAGMQSPAMAEMPAAYALPGAGEAPGMAPGAPLVHTPIPPGLIGPPPDLNEGPGLGDALHGLEHEMGAEHTPTGNAVWRTAHPSAQKWAAKRHGGAVRTPKPGIIAIGLMLTGLGAYLLAIFLPSKQPLTAAKIEEISRQAGVDEKAWRFTEQLIDAANINAGLFVLLGIVIVLRGALFRQQPQGRAHMGKPAIMLIACFFLLAVSFAALLITASA